MGKDVAEKLGYSAARNAIATHVEDDDKLMHQISASGQMRDYTFINESGVYSLIFSSKLPTAKRFKHWVTSEILPKIRKTGGYVGDTDKFINNYLSDLPREYQELFKATQKQNEAALLCIREMKNVINAQQVKIEEDAPKVAFADTVANSSDCITIGAFSKVLYDKEGINIGRNRLFKYLRDNRYLRRNNEPYQRWVEAGLFQYTPIQINTVYGEQVYNQTQITGKGQIYLSEKLRTDNSQHKLSEYLHTMRHTGFPTKTKK